MSVIGDRADRHGERRKLPGLTLVMPGLDEVKQVVVGPVTGLDDCAALGVPGDTVGVARALGDDLEFPRPRVQPPNGAVEVVALAFPVDDVAFVEHAVEPVEPAVRAPGEGTGQLVEIGSSEPGDDDFAAHLFAVSLPKEQQVGRVEHPYAAVADGDAGGDVEPLGEDRDFGRHAPRR